MKSDDIKEAANIFTVRDKINSHRQKCTEPQSTPSPLCFLLKRLTAFVWHPIFVYKPRNSVIIPYFLYHFYFLKTHLRSCSVYKLTCYIDFILSILIHFTPFNYVLQGMSIAPLFTRYHCVPIPPQLLLTELLPSSPPLPHPTHTPTRIAAKLTRLKRNYLK